MEIELAQVRADTPGCESVVHFNNAGAALMPRPVLDSVIDHLLLEARIGGYEAADQAHRSIEGVYDSIADLIGCLPDEVAVIENATRAWDMAFYAIPFEPGDRVLTAGASYASNFIAFLQMARNRGISIELIPDDEHGQLCVNTLAQMMDDRVKLVAITHIPTNGGLVNPAAAVGRVLRNHDALYLLDACQSVGHLPVDVGEIGCDMLSATGRKYLRGPRGTGFLYVRRDKLKMLEPPLLDLHAATWTASDRYETRDDARRFENWECNVAAKIGLGVAVNYALGLGMDAIWARIHKLADSLRGALAGVARVNLLDKGARRGGIVSFNVAGMPAADVRTALAAQSINVTTSTERSTRIDMEQRGLKELVRASVHYYNSEEEVGRFVDAVAHIAGQS